MTTKDFDVIILGGGITGAGTQRDCAMRGLRTLLIERSDIATGATGRNHGLLHSGARYAVNDAESAEECIRENMILRKIASHCIDETDGLFITLPEDDLAYQQTFVEACRKAGINAEIIDPKLAVRLDPAVNPALTGAVRVPDGSVDPFRLCAANMLDAKLHDGQVRLHTEVTGFIREGDTILGVRTRNLQTGETEEFRAPVTVNACGIWGHHIASLAGVNIGMYPAKGALLVFSHRVNQMVINRCRKPSNADILVPGDTVCIIGTTSTHIPFEECDNVAVTPDEVNLLITEGSKLAPSLSSTRILRAYAGVRPLVSADDDPTGRNISRGIVCLDHEKRDGLKGFITITGGKLMTYRLMAEIATDMVCAKLNVVRKCETALIALNQGADPLVSPYRGRIYSPSRSSALLEGSLYLCECEKVTLGEIKELIASGQAETLTQLRRRTRMGMGKCPGRFCALRAARLMCSVGGQSAAQSGRDLADFINERWKGIYPIAWGTTLADGQYMASVYQGLCGLGKYEHTEHTHQL